MTIFNLKHVYNRFIETAISWLTPERIRLYPATICVLSFFVWGVSIAMGRGLTDASGNIIGADFLTFYTAGKFFLKGRMMELYNIAAQAAFQKNLLAPVSFNAVCYFNYPPFATLFCATFALGNYLTGLLLWWGTGVLALAFSLHLLRRELMALRVCSTGRLFLMSFLFFPTIVWFLYGQDTALTLLLYTLTFVMLRRENDFAAGLALGLLLYKPQLAIAVGMVLIIKWRWRALIGGVIGAGIWLAIGFAISPLVMKEYLRLIPYLFELQRRHDLIATWGYHNFYGFAALLFDGFWKKGSNILALLLMVGGVSAVLYFWRRIDWKPGTRSWDMMMAATFTLGLLISPHLYLYDLMLLLLPLVIIWSYYPHGTRDRPLDSGPLLIWTALLYTACFFSSSISLAQLRLSVLAGLPRAAFQCSVPIIIGWVYTVIILSKESCNN
jgi:hypothetical protein